MLTVTPSSERVGKHHLEAIDTQVTALSRISTAVLTSQRDLCVAQSHDHNRSGQRSTLMDGAAREAALCQGVCACVSVFVANSGSFLLCGSCFDAHGITTLWTVEEAGLKE